MTTTTTAGRDRPTNPNASGLAAHPPLRVLPDQPERWTATGREPLTWDQARERVAAADREDGQRQDLAVGDLSSWLVGPGEDGVAVLTPVPVPGRPHNGQRFPIRARAFGHLATAIGAPPQYLLRLPAKLATACLATGMQQIHPDQSSKLLRLAGGQVRAVASDRYAPLDNDLVLDTAERTLRALGRLSDVRVTDLAVGPTLSMRIVLPGEDKPVKAGDVVQVGVDLLNGETLNRSVSITPMTHRLVCLNGMRRWEHGAARRWSHVGDPERLRQAFTDALPVALSEAHGLRDAMARSLDRLVDDAIAEIDGLGETLGWTRGQRSTVTDDLFRTRGVALPADSESRRTAALGAGAVSVWDVANAVTHVAQTLSVDDRLGYEEAAGAYLLRRTR